METEYRVLIGGELVKASTGETMKVINPANGTTVGEVPKCGEAEINEAVESARKAFPAWASKTIAERGKMLIKLSDILLFHREEMARMETMQYGGPLRKTSGEIPASRELIEYMIGVARSKTGETLPIGPSCNAMTVREPLGVVGLITPWNFPFITVLAKLIPALLTGNTCVVKPPSTAPITALKLGEFTIEAGMPPGAVNIVTGPGPVAGEALVKHPGVAKIGFTGDSAVGKRIMSLAGGTVKPVCMELGGKNAFIILADADIDSAVEGAVWSAFYNSGQNCASPSRFLIHESIYEEFNDKFIAATKKVKYGDPLNPETMMGPLAYREHRDSVERYIEMAKKEGAKLLLGGERPDTPETKDGFFVAPTIFGDCQSQMRFMQEEIFGPVVGLMRFKTPEEAVNLANDTRYGLCASVWTKEIRTALVMASKIQVGTVWVNQHLAFSFEIPWGGCKESGFGKENSTLVLDEYTMIKHIWIDLVGTPATPWQNSLK